MRRVRVGAGAAAVAARRLELTPLHLESCATRAVNGRTASPHQVSETSVKAARAAGFAVAYVPYGDDTGGVVVDGEAALS
jgi:hypothetical protein